MMEECDMWCLELADLFSVIPVLPGGACRKEVAAPRRLHLCGHVQPSPDNSGFCPGELAPVPLRPVSSKAWLTMVSCYLAAPGSRAAQPAGAAGLLLGLSLRVGPRADLLVHRSRAV